MSPPETGPPSSMSSPGNRSRHLDWRWVAGAVGLLIAVVSAGVLARTWLQGGRGADDLRPDPAIRLGVLETLGIDEPSGRTGDPVQTTPPEAGSKTDTDGGRPASTGAPGTEKLLGEAWAALDRGDLDTALDTIDDYLDSGGSEDDIADLLWALDNAEDDQDGAGLPPENPEALRVADLREQGASEEVIAELLVELRKMGLNDPEIAELERSAAADREKGAGSEGLRLGRRADRETPGTFRLGAGADERVGGSEVITLSAFGEDERPRAAAVFQVTPGDAEVFLDDVLLGPANALKRHEGGVSVPVGLHTVKITRQGYVTETYEMIFAPGGVTVVASDLRKQR